MGYALCMGTCGACGQLMSFNPVRVPSFDFGRGTGKEPICEGCMARVNEQRRKMGLPPHHIYPDAYEAVDEGELPND